MAYTKPSPADFKAVFPSFSAVPDPTIQFVLDEADGRADDTWPDGERATGVMLLAAHLLTMDGQGASQEAQFGAFRRLKIGSLELEKAVSGNAPQPGSLGSTSFGQRYLAIVRRLFPPVLVV